MEMSATTTANSAVGVEFAGTQAALMPASLPPIATI
jgi:hypothetical protein